MKLFFYRKARWGRAVKELIDRPNQSIKSLTQQFSGIYNNIDFDEQATFMKEEVKMLLEQHGLLDEQFVITNDQLFEAITKEDIPSLGASLEATELLEGIVGKTIPQELINQLVPRLRNNLGQLLNCQVDSIQDSESGRILLFIKN